ncbi:MAG TPA: hypothetical protein VI485_31100 [Vicinamibacterales bacterium]|nr:hypothetical protein [Vicinamibacterales bacterium]
MIKVVALMVPAVAVLVGLGTSCHVGASQSDVLARFEGSTGLIPVSSVAPPQNGDLTFANVVQNVVRGVPPSGQPWKIADLRAIVHTDGRIRVVGRGLLLNGGNLIGQSLVLKVFATVLCDVTPPFVQHSTNPDAQQLDPVHLDASGNFRLDDTLDPVPSACASPLLLIRGLNNGAWIAAGFPKADRH